MVFLNSIVKSTLAMAEHSKRPEEMQFRDDVARNWKLWKQKFNLYLLASDKSEKKDEVKIAILLNLLGDEGLQIYNTFEYSEEEDHTKLVIVLKKFDDYCNPVKNLVYEHFKFFKREQHPSETMDQFVTALRQLASTCEFKEKDVLIRDRLVIGIGDLRIQEELLRHPDLKLSEAIQICRSMESSVATQKEMSKDKEQSVSVCAVDWRAKNSSKQDKHSTGPASGQFNENYPGTSGKYSNYKKGNNCNNCGLVHDSGRCPASNRYCSRCKNPGHYRKFCKSKFVYDVAENEHYDDNYDESGHESCEEGDHENHIVWTIIDSSVNSVEWYEPILILNKQINLKIDTGSQVNILNHGDFKRLGLCDSELSKTSTTLSSYSGHKIEVRGKILVNCSFNGHPSKLPFYVLKSNSACSILGLQAAKELKIISENKKHKNSVETINTDLHNSGSLQDILDNHKTVFSGVGKVNTMHKITLRDDAISHISAARKIPLALKNSVKKKLDEMVTEKIIIPVTEPTDWVHPIVIAPKPNGDIRICMDPRKLNMYIKRENFHIPTTDCLFSELSGAKYFTLLDASQAFLQIPLDNESSKLCTIATSWGRFRYLRLPYGISSAPEIFQKFIYDTLSGVHGVIAYFDDILIFGRTIEEHNLNLDVVLSKISKSGLTLNLLKSKICVPKVKFLGHIISGSGIAADEKKTQAIRDMSPPRNKKDLQRFLGMIVYLAKFVPNLSQETNTLRRLLSNKVEWLWTENEQKCFDHLKQLVMTTPVLSYFNSEKETILSVDASPYGLGAFIAQDNHPIEYASVSLTPTQQRYNHIEKELLALTYGCERFHYFLFCKKFKIQTDHRPLLGLLKKPIDELSPRIQRLAIRLLRYNFDLVYVPGKQMLVADALSRDPNSEKINTDYLDTQLFIHAVIATSTENEKRLISAINEDSTLSKVKYYVLQGWPDHKSNVSTEAKKFWNIRSEIYVHKDVLFYKKRLLIPLKLQHEFLELMHKSHQGVVSSKKLAQECIYWPGICNDIENLVLSCQTCQKYARRNQREPLQPHKIPDLPWEKIGIDFMYLDGLNFLIIVDYFSKFVIVNKLHSKTADSVISALKNIFSMHGLPLEIFSDNGPPFNSADFSNLATKYEIKLTTSSPHYPRSNGMVERTVQTVKGLLTKAMRDDEDPFLSILSYNSTPKQDIPAPCDLLMGRKLRTALPVPRNALKPKYPLGDVNKKLKIRQEKQAFHYNKSTKQLSDLKPYQKVLMQEGSRNWRSATVSNKSGPNDYRVRTDDNVDFRRNRSHLRPLKQLSKENGNPLTEVGNAPNDDVIDERLVSSEQTTSEDFCDSDVRSDPSVVKSPNHNNIVTRSGRIVKRPIMLDL